MRSQRVSARSGVATGRVYVRKPRDPPPLLVLREEPGDVHLPAFLPQPPQFALRLLHGGLCLRRALHVLSDDGCS